MVYINSRGEVVSQYRTNFFWKIVYFFVAFFKTLVGWETSNDKKDDNKYKNGNGGTFSSPFSGGGGGGGNSRGNGNNKDNKGQRPFGPRGFSSITDLPPPPPMMGCSSGGCCG